jgi:hypothetical protein
MSNFTDVYKQELKSKGVLSSIGSAALKRTREKLDIRNMLFGGSGAIAATGQKVFGKGYQAIQKGGSTAKAVSENIGTQSIAMDQLLVSAQKQESQLAIIAKNTMNSNAMARDMNVTRQNIMKLVTMSGGKASRGADMFFKDAAARESAYESQFKKGTEKQTTPTPVAEKSKSDGGLLSLFGGIATSIVGTIRSTLGGIPDLLKSIFSTDNLLKVLGITGNVLGGFARLLPMLISPAFLGIIAAVAGATWLMKWLESKNDEANTEEEKHKRVAGDRGSQSSKLAARDVPITPAVKELLGEDKTDEEVSSFFRGEIATKDELAKAITSAEAAGKRNLDLTDSKVVRDAQEKMHGDAMQSMQDGSYNAVEAKRFSSKAESMSISPTRVGEIIPGMDFESYASTVGKRESGNNYKAENSIGYLGKYQFGAAALEDLGIIKPGASKKGKNKEVLSNSENWNLKGGKQEFLNSPELQENAFAVYTSKNYGKLIKLKVLDKNSTAEEKAGYLMAAHLLGPGGAKKLKMGEVGADAYGTTSASYYNLGSKTQASLMASSSNSGSNLTQNSATLAAMIRDMNVAQAPNVVVNAPQTSVNSGKSSSAPVASATNVDALELFFQASM